LVTAHDGVPVWIEQRSELSATLMAEHDIEAHPMDNGSLLIRLPAAEGFEPDSAIPAPTLTTMLDRIVPLLNAHADTGLRILGHTDSIGSELYNLRLSIERAEAVMDYLRARGVALGRLSADGRGEAEPIADNATESGRAINRRVEIVVRPLE
jgi:outer membrane protein OmpA-like peptidoglycan-associated protein